MPLITGHHTLVVKKVFNSTTIFDKWGVRLAQEGKNVTLWKPIKSYPTRQHCFTSINYPKRESGHIYLIFATALWSQWDPTDTKMIFWA